MTEEYNGELPKHVIAQLQEHTSGGFMLFRINGDGDIISDFAFDNETSYLALVKKGTSMLMALNTIDNAEALRSFSNNSNSDNNDDDEENQEYEEGDDDDDYQEK